MSLRAQIEQLRVHGNAIADRGQSIGWAAAITAVLDVLRRRWLSEHELLLVLRGEVDRYDSDSAAAKAFGVTRGHLSRVLREQKPITARLALSLGYEPQTIFIPWKERQR